MARMPSDPRRSPSGSSSSARRNGSAESPHAGSDHGSAPEFMMRSVMSLPDTLRMRSQARPRARTAFPVCEGVRGAAQPSPALQLL